MSISNTITDLSMAWQKIAGTVADPSGARVESAMRKCAKSPRKSAEPQKQMTPGNLLVGPCLREYKVQVSSSGFRTASQAFILQPRDRAVVSATLAVGASSEAVEVTAANVVVQTEMAAVGQEWWRRRWRGRRGHRRRTGA